MKTVAESRAKRPSKKIIPAPPDSTVSRRRLRLAPSNATTEGARSLSITTPIAASSPAAPLTDAHVEPRTCVDDLADMAAEVLAMVEEIDNALCQATLDVDSLTSTKNMSVDSFDARLERFVALRGKIDHELLTCFRWLSGLRVLASATLSTIEVSDPRTEKAGAA